VAIFIDIMGVFNNVDPHILINDNLHQEIYRKFIGRRRLSFMVNGTLVGPFDSFKDTPQDSTLSLLLFNTYFKDMAYTSMPIYYNMMLSSTLRNKMSMSYQICSTLT